MSEENNEYPETFEIHYIKSKYLRTVQADGATGGFSPQGKFMITFYSEHPPLPDQITHMVNEDGSMGDIVELKGKFGIIREKEVVVSMDPQNAAQLANWIRINLKELEEARAEQNTS